MTNSQNLTATKNLKIPSHTRCSHNAHQARSDFLAQSFKKLLLSVRQTFVAWIGHAKVGVHEIHG